jgi:hypothetical protein
MEEAAELVVARHASLARAHDIDRRKVERLLVEGLVVRLRVFGVQALADRVVLEHEERGQQREADSEVARDTPQVDVGFDVLQQQPSGVMRS